MAERRNRCIELFTKDNFDNWIIDIHAELRDRELWDYTQERYARDNHWGSGS